MSVPENKLLYLNYSQGQPGFVICLEAFKLLWGEILLRALLSRAHPMGSDLGQMEQDRFEPRLLQLSQAVGPQRQLLVPVPFSQFGADLSSRDGSLGAASGWLCRRSLPCRG